MATHLNKSSIIQERMLRLAQRRCFASAPSGKPGSRFRKTAALLATAFGGATGIYVYVTKKSPSLSSTVVNIDESVESVGATTESFYRQVGKDVGDLLESNPSYDGIGHYGPVLVRLAWHASGTFDVKSQTGGSNGATMRFSPESEHGANAGLVIARNLLEPIKQKYGDQISYADLWTLAGVVAIKEMGGPQIAWRPGRSDSVDGKRCPPDGRLPDATKDQRHVRDIFYRMGLINDQEIVALCGAHALGKCHIDRSGFTGPWTFSPTSFTNAYFTLLLSEKWIPKKQDLQLDEKTGKEKWVSWKGPLQYTDEKTKTLMMLPSDMSLIQDPEFRKWVEIYAADDQRFFNDFAKAFGRLLELGVPDKVLKNQAILF